MEILVLIVPLALLIATIFVICFIKAVNSGQFEDLDTPAHRILLEEQKIIEKSENSKS